MLALHPRHSVADIISHEDLWKHTNRDKMQQTNKKKEMELIDRTLIKRQNRTTRQALSWNPQGKRRRGRSTEEDCVKKNYEQEI